MVSNIIPFPVLNVDFPLLTFEFLLLTLKDMFQNNSILFSE